MVAVVVVEVGILRVAVGVGNIPLGGKGIVGWDLGEDRNPAAAVDIVRMMAVGTPRTVADRKDTVRLQTHSALLHMNLPVVLPPVDDNLSDNC